MSRRVALVPTAASTQEQSCIAYWDFRNEHLVSARGNNAALVCTRAGAASTRFNRSGLREVVAANAPRFDYNPVTLATRGLLHEPPRTNSLWPSNDLTHSNWNKVTNPCTVYADQATGKDGTASLDLVVATAGAGRHSPLNNGFGSLTAGQTYIMSVEVKRGSTRYAAIAEGGDAAWHVATFDFDAPAITSSSGLLDSSYEDEGGGIYRVWIAWTQTNTAGAQAQVGPSLTSSNTAMPSWTADGSETVYVGHAQTENAASYAVRPSSVIPTTTAAASGGGDLIQIPLSSIANWNAATFTIYGQLLLNFTEATSVVAREAFSIDDGTSSERHIFRINTAASAVFVNTVQDGGSTQAALSGSAIVAGTAYRYAVGAAANNFALSTQGAASVTDTSGTMPSPTTLTVGSSGAAGSNHLFGWSREFAIYTPRLTNGQGEGLSLSGPYG